MSRGYTKEFYRYIQPEWDGRICYPSQGNVYRHPNYRNFFTNQRLVITKTPKNYKVRNLVKKRREHYLSNRDPRFYDPEREAGWDNRAGVTAAAVNHKKHHYRKYFDGGLEGDPVLQQYYSIGAPAHANPLDSSALPPMRGGTGRRHPFLKKYSRAALSPFLARMNGFEEPPILVRNQRGQSHRQNMTMTSPEMREQASSQNNYWRTMPASARASTQDGYYDPRYQWDDGFTNPRPPSQSNPYQGSQTSRARNYNREHQHHQTGSAQPHRTHQPVPPRTHLQRLQREEEKYKQSISSSSPKLSSSSHQDTEKYELAATQPRATELESQSQSQPQPQPQPHSHSVEEEI